MVIYLALVPLSIVIVQAAFLLREAYRRETLIVIAPLILGTPFLTQFPAGWLSEVIPAGTNYWGGDNPVAVLFAWPSLTAILYGAMWWFVRPNWRDG